MLTQLQTPLPLTTPKGKASAVAIIDYGPNCDLLWVTFLHDSGECWTFNNTEIRQETLDYTTPMPNWHSHKPSLSAATEQDNVIPLMRGIRASH